MFDIYFSFSFFISRSKSLSRSSFATADISDTLQQLTEIAIATLFESLIIHGKSLLYILVQTQCSPTAEACSNLRLHTITKRNNHIQIIVGNVRCT